MCSESNAVVDPGFPRWRRGANPQKGEVSNLLFGVILDWVGDGVGPEHPLPPDPPIKFSD